MKSRTFYLLGITITLLIGCGLMFGASPNGQDQKGAMEMFGIGPELFQDRGIAWVKCFSEIIKIAISELGIIAVAVISVIQLIKSKAESKAAVANAKAELGERIERNDRRITAVALAAVPSTENPMPVTTAGQEPLKVEPVESH